MVLKIIIGSWVIASFRLPNCVKAQCVPDDTMDMLARHEAVIREHERLAQKHKTDGYYDVPGMFRTSDHEIGLPDGL